MRIGMDIGMSKSPDAATFETGPAYEYSFAMDFSKLTADDVNMGQSATTNFPLTTLNSRMISVADSHILSGGDGILYELADGQANIGNLGFPMPGSGQLDETFIKPSFTSHSQNGIPDGSISTVYRYVSLVMTYHSVNSEGTSVANYNTGGYMEIEDSDGNKYGHTEFHGDKGGAKDYPRWINGVNISIGFDTSVRNRYSGMLTSGTDEFDKPMTFTWDMLDAVDTASYDALTGPIDPAELRYFHSGGQVAITIHGIIISKSVPGEVTLPIHTSRPVSEFA